MYVRLLLFSSLICLLLVPMARSQKPIAISAEEIALVEDELGRLQSLIKNNPNHESISKLSPEGKEILGYNNIVTVVLNAAGVWKYRHEGNDRKLKMVRGLPEDLLHLKAVLGSYIFEWISSHWSRASVTQMIGGTIVAIDYIRPEIEASGRRAIFGGLVPYGQVWRAGSYDPHDVTTVSFSNDVKVNGRELSRGTYSFTAIPGEGEWTVIFHESSRTPNNWGAFNYAESGDSFQIEAIPTASEYNERLTFDFENLKENSVDLVMSWEEVKIPIRVETNVRG